MAISNMTLAEQSLSRGTTITERDKQILRARAAARPVRERPTHMANRIGFVAWCGADLRRVRATDDWAQVTCRKCIKMSK